jgi:hypothetical protein
MNHGESLKASMNAVFLAAVHTFYKKPETTSKFWAPEG